MRDLAFNVPRRVETAIFDWDGTLLDSFEASFLAFSEVFQFFQIEFSRELFRKHYRPDWHILYRQLGLSESKWDEADRLWLGFYDRIPTYLKAGAFETLQRLTDSGIRIGILSGGQRARVLAEANQHHILQFVTRFICEDDASFKKPDPRLLHFALEALQASSSTSIYVGDTVADLEMGKKASVATLLVVSEYTYVQFLESLAATDVIPAISLLPDLLLRSP